MISRKFGSLPNAVPIVGQGTWNLPTRGAAIEAAKLALKRGIELGATHIDTAEMYGQGESEEIIGAVIKGLPRERLFLVSKVSPSNATFKGTIKACDASLKRLKTQYLDCFLLHWRGSHPLEDTMRALEQLVVDGKIRSLGVSNFDVDDLKEGVSYLAKEKIACNQVLYNLGERGIERNLMPYCKNNEIAIVGYTPFGNISSHGKQAEILAGIAANYGATVRQVALAFLVRDDLLFAIPKAANVDHVVENIKAGSLKLEAKDIEAISNAFPAPKQDVPLATG
jgi:diketogulonate reductase-like aldo/keto reductase